MALNEKQILEKVNSRFVVSGSEELRLYAVKYCHTEAKLVTTGTIMFKEKEGFELKK